MVVRGTQEAVLRVKACRKEDESQKSEQGLASGDPRHAGISVWDFSFQVTRREGGGEGKKNPKVSSSSIPHECCSCIIYQSQPG